ncbi:MAG: zf-TFIIB domain-containing protein [Paracoccaceae bacterium]
MLCPIDGATLVMADRSGVEIDYCPKCRGVWLDRGELDKILERAAGMSAPVAAPAAAAPRQPAPTYQPEPPRQAGGYADGGRRRDDDDDDYRPRGKRRESFLGDIFDF